MTRGQIWWTDLPEPVASGPGYSRPVIIVQSDPFNHSRIGTVVAVVITSNLHLALAPGNVSLAARKTGLSKDSVANVSQIITISKQFLREKAGELDYKTLSFIDEGLRLVLGI